MSYDREYDEQAPQYAMDWGGDRKHGYEAPFEGNPEGVVFHKSLNRAVGSYRVNGFPAPLQINFDATTRPASGRACAH